jgi:hypothetical protein
MGSQNMAVRLLSLHTNFALLADSDHGVWFSFIDSIFLSRNIPHADIKEGNLPVIQKTKTQIALGTLVALVHTL